MTNETLPPMVCASCGRQIPPRSRFCLVCGAPTSFGPKPRPRSLTTIAFFGILTGVLTLLFDQPWAALTGPHDAYQIFIKTFDWLGVPLNILLLAASIGLWGDAKPWARQAMFWWAGLITIYESAQLLIFIAWISPRMTAADEGDMSQLTGTFGSDIGRSLISTEYCVYWISMVSLAVWAWWVLRRPAAQAYFEPQNESNAASIS